MEAGDIINQVKEFANTDPQIFWITVGVIVLILFFLLKPSSGEGQSSVGMDKFNWQVFKRRR